MKITLLGTGTSTGVPIPGCDCEVCKSKDPRNKRLRCSVYIELPPVLTLEGQTHPGEEGCSILIDTGPDLRQQALRFGFTRLDAVLYTHTHADHTFGIDDLRSFNFINRKSIPLYASDLSAEILERQFNYCFFPNPGYEGGSPPNLTLTRIQALRPLTFAGVEILPLRLEHGTMEVFGYRIGPFAYLTDCSNIPTETREQLKGLDVLVLDGLRERPHKTHFTIEQAAHEAALIGAKQTYLTHISHELEHATTDRKLEELATVPVALAFDGLVLHW